MALIKKFTAQRIASLFFLLFLISLFFPVRYVFPTQISMATGEYSDFTSISLYLSDIFLFIVFFFTLWSHKSAFLKRLFTFNFSLFTLITWLILAIFIFHRPISGLNIWFFVKIVELAIVSYGTVRLAFSGKRVAFRNGFLKVFLALGTIQSIIGLLQFIGQSPIGLNSIGEQIIYPNLIGVAKVVSDGTAYIRAYGTFPHPNLLSAFLVATILINLYLIVNTTWRRITRYWLNLALFVNVLGLTVTFSRGAYIAMATGLVVFFLGLIVQKGKFWKPLGIVALATLVSFLLFKPYLITRATFSDQSTVDRKFYDIIGLKMLKDKPFFGTGAGESVLHVEQYSNRILQPWEKQPPHNYFIIAAAELGIPFALILLWIFLSHLFHALRYTLHASFDPYNLLLATLLLSFLLLMQFDHYFYTLQQTQILLWMVLGLIAAETKNPIRQLAEED